VRVLLVRLRLLGDVVFTTPLVRALRRTFPDARLTYLVEEAAAPVLRGNPHLDELIVIPRRSGAARLRDDLSLGLRLRRERFDVAIDLHGGPRSAWLTWASGAPMRIGYTIKGRTWMYTHTVPRAADLTPRHSVCNQWDLLRPLGIDECDPSRDALEMADDPQAAARVDERLCSLGFRADNTLVVIHVSAGNPFRRWPAEHFAALAAGLARQDPNRWIVLTAGPSDRVAAEAIAADARARLGGAGGTIVHPDLDVAELRAATARAGVYIGGDSGPLHVASTTRTPVVALMGPTLPERSRPWRDPRWFAEVIDAGPLPCRPCHQRHCVPGDFRCLTAIATDRVLEAAERALQGQALDDTRCDFPDLLEENHTGCPSEP
jgi:lipopolysaccharide heptosyltransferase II